MLQPISEEEYHSSDPLFRVIVQYLTGESRT
jgi:hypothetical protein